MKEKEVLMVIMDPCRKCLVKVVCSERCPASQDFWDTRRTASEWFSKIAIVVSLIGLSLSIILSS